VEGRAWRAAEGGRRVCFAGWAVVAGHVDGTRKRLIARQRTGRKRNRARAVQGTMNEASRGGAGERPAARRLPSRIPQRPPRPLAVSGATLAGSGLHPAIQGWEMGFNRIGKAASNRLAVLEPP